MGTGRLALSTDHVAAGRLVGGVTRIVTTAYRYKPPPRKRKLALASPAVITRANKRRDPEPANDDHPSKPAPAAAKPAIVTTTSRKRVKLLRAEERTAELDAPEADAAMRAWLDRAKCGHGPARWQSTPAATLAELGDAPPAAIRLGGPARALQRVPLVVHTHPRADAAQDYMSAQN